MREDSRNEIQNCASSTRYKQTDIDITRYKLRTIQLGSAAMLSPSCRAHPGLNLIKSLVTIEEKRSPRNSCGESISFLFLISFSLKSQDREYNENGCLARG